MLVLGEEANEGGLNKSILERLMIKYRDSPEGVQHNHVTLVTNYRCHEDIRNLSGKLFYPDVHLTAPGNQTPLVPFGEYGKQSSIHFLCSEIGETDIRSDVNKMEASALAEMLMDIDVNWPMQHVGEFKHNQMCIMSKSRRQVGTIPGAIQIGSDVKLCCYCAAPGHFQLLG